MSSFQLTLEQIFLETLYYAHTFYPINLMAVSNVGFGVTMGYCPAGQSTERVVDAWKWPSSYPSHCYKLYWVIGKEAGTNIQTRIPEVTFPEAV
jgi:hypothetical protein